MPQFPERTSPAPGLCQPPDVPKPFCLHASIKPLLLGYGAETSLHQAGLLSLNESVLLFLLFKGKHPEMNSGLQEYN